MIPRLLGKPQLVDGLPSIVWAGNPFVIDGVGARQAKTAMVALRAMDGTRTVDQIARAARTDAAFVHALTGALDHVGLVLDEREPEVRPALDVLFELEDLANGLLYESIYRNAFWHGLLNETATVPLQVFHGMAIENYHFLFRESYFDAPALNFPASTRARGLMNQFYGEEYGHDELILKGLMSLGITREDLADTIPLPQTMALCNALAFWARYEPVFFFSTLGILEGKDITVDSYIDACERRGLPAAFVAPIRGHAQINMEGEHGSLTRAIFEHLPPIDPRGVLQMRARTRLFIQLYDGFYTGIWNYYSGSSPLLRRLSTLLEGP